MCCRAVAYPLRMTSFAESTGPAAFRPFARPAHGRWRTYALEMLAVAAAAAQTMSFLDHLEELRKRLIWSSVFIALACGVSWMFAAELYEIASAPLRANPAVILSLSRPQDIFGLYFKVALVAAIFLAAPLVLWQAWLFVSPGLHAHERRYAIPVVVAASVCFLAGGAFGYFVAFPAALSFLLDWMIESHITPVINATDYFDLFASVVVALGVIFQIPVVIFVLSRFGLVTARFLARKMNYAVFGAAVVAAIITPTSDPGNMLLIAGPMIALYAVGIVIAWIFGKRRQSPG